MNVELSVSSLLETLEVEAQLEKKTIPSMLSGEISSEDYSFTKEILIDIDKEVGEDTPVNMDQDRGVDSLPIGPLVRLRGLPIEVPQNLHAVDMPSYLPKFYGTKDEDPSKDNKGHIERLASSLVTNPEYWLV